jgi:hypothetical protein
VPLLPSLCRRVQRRRAVLGEKDSSNDSPPVSVSIRVSGRIARVSNRHRIDCAAAALKAMKPSDARPATGEKEVN